MNAPDHEKTASRALPVVDPFEQTRSDLDAWRSGNREALGRIIERYQRPLALLILRRIRAIHNASVRAKIDPDDVFQTAMIKVLDDLPRFQYQGPRSMYAWMRAIAERQVSDHMDRWSAARRDPNREHAVESTAIDGREVAHAVRDRRPGPATGYALADERNRLLAALAELDERECSVVTLHHFYGASWAEVALEVGVSSEDAVRKVYARALPKLGRRLTSRETQ